MKRATYSSPAIAKQIERKYGSHAKSVQVTMHHKRAVNRYVMRIEEAHKKAANSKLRFGP